MCMHNSLHSIHKRAESEMQKKNPLRDIFLGSAFGQNRKHLVKP